MKELLTTIAVGLVPGGGVVAALRKLWAGVLAVVGYVFDGVAVCFLNPATFIVCAGFAIAGGLAVGKLASREINASLEQARTTQRAFDAYKAKQKAAGDDDKRLASVARNAGEAAAAAVMAQSAREADAAKALSAAPGASPAAPGAAIVGGADPATAGVRDPRTQPAKRSAVPRCERGMLGGLYALWGSCN